MYCAHLAGEPLTVTSVVQATESPPTAGLRWLGAVEEAGLVRSVDQASSPILNAAINASCGMLTLPYSRIRAFPFFCLSSSFRFRVASPP
jgi:hypothetical protein